MWPCLIICPDDYLDQLKSSTSTRPSPLRTPQAVYYVIMSKGWTIDNKEATSDVFILVPPIMRDYYNA